MASGEPSDYETSSMDRRRLRLLLESLLHSQRTQLWHRLLLTVRRRSGLAAANLRRPPPTVTVRVERTCGVRGHLTLEATARGEWELVGGRIALRVPMDWRVKSIEVGRPLAELEVHYLEFLRALEDSWFLAFSEDWVIQNGTPRGRWWNTSWNSYGLSIRCIVWMQELARRWEGLPEEPRARLCDEVARQVRFLEHNLERDLGGNHLLKDATALVWASRFFVGTDAERWAALGTRILREQLPEQVLSDGMHFERSFSYHAEVLRDLLDCWHALESQSLRAELAPALDRMAQVIADGAHPDGMASLFNDAGLGKGPVPAACLAVYAAARGNAPRPRAVFALEDAGYFGLRTAGELFLADCGPIGPDHLPAHGHGDILAFEWSVAGKRIVVDFGVYEYTAGPWRARSRATASHNTVTVADADQCEFWSSFRVGRRARILERRFERKGDGFVLEGSHDGFRNLRGRPIHWRRFDAHPGNIVVQDEVRGGRGQPVRARLLFHPECRVELTPTGALVEHTGTKIAIAFACPARVEDACWCPDFGKKVDTRQLVLEYGAAPCAGGFQMTVQGDTALERRTSS